MERVLPRPAWLAPARQAVLATSAVTATAASLAQGLVAAPGAAPVAAAAYGVFAVTLLPGASPAPKIYSALIVALLAVAGLQGAGLGEAATAAGARGALLIALFSVMALLGRIALSADVIHRCGQVLVHQRAGRRYLALTLGGHVMALLLNIGAMHLLGTLVDQAVKGRHGGEGPQRITRQRMLLAVQRGVGATLMWSPLTVCFALVFTVLPAQPVPAFIALGIAAALVAMAFGWWLDRRGHPGRARPAAAVAPDPWPFAGLALLVAALFAGAAILASVFETRLILGVIGAVPVIALAWLALTALTGAHSEAQRQPGRAMAGLLGDFLARVLPDQRRELGVIANAGVLAALVVLVVPEGWLAGPVAALPRPVAVAAGLWAVVLAGQVGLNPIISATIAGNALAATAPAEAALLPAATALVWGWSLNLVSSPFTGAVLLTARHGFTDAPTVGRRWNLAYWLSAAAALSVVVAGLEIALN